MRRSGAPAAVAPSRACSGVITVLLLALLVAGCRMAHIPPPEPAPSGAGTEASVGSAGLRVTDATATESDGGLQFAVSLGQAHEETVTVSYATEDASASAGEDYQAVSGRLTFLPGTAAARNLEVPIFDDSLAETNETLVLRLRDMRAAPPVEASAIGTIVDDDRRAITVEPPAIVVREGSSGTYRVALTSAPSGVVTVTAASRSSELTAAPAQLSFSPSGWQGAQTVTVTAARDADAVADAPVVLRHTASGAEYDGAVAEVRVTVVEADAATLAVASAAATESTGLLRFEVTLSVAHGGEVQVDYATGAPADTATEDEDYAAASDRLIFAAGSTASQTIEVAVLDDALDEPQEQFTVLLSNANVQFAGGDETLAVSGTIEDDDPVPQLRIADATVAEDAGDGVMNFPVSLEAASGRTVTVTYATADETAEAGADYTSVAGVLTFAAGTSAGTVAVTILDDEHAEVEETFTVTLSGPRNATLTPATATATGTIADDGDPRPHLTNLEVEGGGTMEPAFDSGTFHYALACNSSKVRVTAAAAPAGVQLTLLHADETDNQVFTGSMNKAEVNVSDDTDVVIEAADPGATVRYVIHCLPEDFPTIKILEKADDVADGFLYVAPDYQTSDSETIRYFAILDNNGVPRIHHSRGGGRIFEPVRYPLTVNNQEVKYIRGRTLLSASFAEIHRVTAYSGFSNNHEFKDTDRGNIIEVLHYSGDRDFSPFEDPFGNPYGDRERVKDTVIREYHPVTGDTSFYWHSWKHRVTYLLGDCLEGGIGIYAMVNSLQIVNGDVVASSRGCSQVWKIKRADGSGDIEWKLGGSDPGPDSDANYLPIVNDDEGEFCGQHTATLTGRETVMLFDNGRNCQGPRKTRPRLTRAVEYDISSGTQAVLVNHFGLPPEYGISETQGSVEEVEEGRWLISWGRVSRATVSADQTIAVSEVEPVSVASGAARTSGRVFLHLHMSKDGARASTYRARRGPEVDIPLNLP